METEVEEALSVPVLPVLLLLIPLSEVGPSSGLHYQHSAVALPGTLRLEL